MPHVRIDTGVLINILSDVQLFKHNIWLEPSRDEERKYLFH